MIELPQMTHWMAASWSQPPADQMAVYDDIAIMNRSTLMLLPEYSASIPTGVYDGKMWRCALGQNKWLLCWYGPSDDPERCLINRRPIRLIRNDDGTYFGSKETYIPVGQGGPRIIVDD